MASVSSLEDLSPQEAHRLALAIQDPEFRSLLSEYASTLGDPENQRLYEEELKASDPSIQSFLRPSPGFVIRAKHSISASDDPSGEKIFINVCSDSQIGGPSFSGRCWRIPYSTSKGRKDLSGDGDGKLCLVMDVIVHPDTLKMAEKNGKFKTLLKETASEAVEAFDPLIKIDRNSIRLPKMAFKGQIHPTVIRKRQTKFEPSYVIKYSDDFQDTFIREPSIKPSHLKVEIDLAGFNSASTVELDVNERNLTLSTKENAPKEFNLQVALPYAVDEEEGKAKFDKITSKLLVTLPVLKTKVDRLISTDSGIEADYPDEVGNLDDVIDDAIVPEVEPALCKPNYAIQCTEDILTITLDVKNVDPKSVIQTSINRGVSLKFISVGSGMYPYHYGFTVAFTSSEDVAGELEGLEVDVWDNNVTIIIPLKESFIDYLIGIHEKDLIMDNNNPALSILRRNSSSKKKTGTTKNKTQALSTITEKSVSRPLSSKTKTRRKHNNKMGTSKGSTESNDSGISADEPPKMPPPSRFRVTSLSEEYVPEDIIVTPTSGIKGILKRRHRCYSESQADQLQRWAAAAAAYSSNDTIDEEEEEEDKSSVTSDGSSKKSVRFSEVVQRQVFRQNASILGMKHKNMKKNEARRRRNERRASEGDADHSRNFVPEKTERSEKQNGVSDLMFDLDIE